MKRGALSVAFVGVSSPGYRSLALDYLQAAVARHPRLEKVATWRFDPETTTDPWWVAYRILRLDPAPDVVALPVYCWTARHVFDVARIVKQARPQTLIVLGGPEVGPIAEQTLAEQPAVDSVVSGEGELTICELLLSLSRGGDPAGIEGLTIRDGARVITGPPREPIPELDEVPSPYVSGRIATDGSAYIETYRGCPHRCAYCYEGKGSTRIRSFSWERIAADIETVATTPGLKAFSFIDPVFNLTPDRLERLAGLMEPHAARGIRLHTIEVDIERITAEQAALLRKAGVVSVETGPQTTGTAALETCARSFDRDRFAAGVEACKSVGISVECDLIIGLPGDTVDDVLAGMDFVTSLDPGKVQMSTLHVLPGTQLWHDADRLGLAFDPQPPHELISTRDLSFADLRRLEVHGNAVADTYRARLSGGPSTTQGATA